MNSRWKSWWEKQPSSRSLESVPSVVPISKDSTGHRLSAFSSRQIILRIGDGKFYEEFVYLDAGGAEFLVERGVRLVGIDYLSIDKFRFDTHPAHFMFLSKNILIL